MRETKSTLTDPSTVRDHPAVAFVEETETVTASQFEAAAESEGIVFVGVANQTGSVLLVDGSHGWTLPGGLLSAPSDWFAAGQEAVFEQTGLDVSIEGIERVHQITNRHEETGRETVTYEVLLRGSLAAGNSEPVGAPAPPSSSAAWFDSVPDESWSEDEEFIRHCLGE